MLDATAIDLIKGVAVSNDHSAEAGFDDGLGTGWSFALMAAWLQGDNHRSVLGSRAGLAQRFDFGMRAAELLVPTFAQNLGFLRNHATDQRVGFDPALSLGGKFQGASHQALIMLRCVHKPTTYLVGMRR